MALEEIHISRRVLRLTLASAEVCLLRARLPEDAQWKDTEIQVEGVRHQVATRRQGVTMS